MALFGRRKHRPEPQAPQYVFDGGQDDLLRAVRGFVTAPNRLTPAAAKNAPQVLPGLVLAVGVMVNDRAEFVAEDDMVAAGLDPAAVREAALDNIRNVDGLSVMQVAIADEPPGFGLIAETPATAPFVAARCAVLSWLVERLFGEYPAHGLLLTIPAATMLTMQPVASARSVAVAKAFAIQAYQTFTETPTMGQISPDVFYATPTADPERVAHIVPASNKALELQIDIAGGQFGKTLFDPPPSGLGLTPEQIAPHLTT